VRIGIDAYVTSPVQGGFTSYIVRIVTHLSAHDEDELVVYVPSVGRVALEGLAGLPWVELRVVDFDMTAFATRTERDTTWHQKILAAALRAERPDVFFGTCQFLPLDWDGPSVVTIHDVIFERHPEFFTPANLDLYRTWTKRAALKADAIVTVSQASADDVKDVWSIHDKPIVATPLAPALPFVPTDREKSRRIVSDQLGIEGGYVLNVAGGHRRKNLAGVVRAFAGLSSELRRANQLVLVNLDAPWVHELVAEHSVADRAVITPRLPDELMPHVYAGATVLLHPSFYEGFGLPVLEAMSCGTPVVSSTKPAIPEVAGDAAILVDPHDDAALTEALTRVLTDPNLRHMLGEAGRRRSKEFDWATTAELTRDVLAGVVRP
jgi:alpha-1,3-rhamnosyl/mannosyltransferase